MQKKLRPLFEADGKHEKRRWTLDGVLERLKSLRRKKAQMNGVEFDHNDAPDEEQQRILDFLGVKLWGVKEA